MTVNNDGNEPQICCDCSESYWEECVAGEVAWCSEQNLSCNKALRTCKIICIRRD